MLVSNSGKPQLMSLLGATHLKSKLFRSQRQVTALVNELGLGPVSLRGKVSAPPPGQGELGKMFKKASEKKNQKETKIL